MSDGDGLYVIVRPDGAKWWRFDYRVNGTRKMMSFGVYPDIPLLKARERRDDARKLVADDIDPVVHVRSVKAVKQENAGNTFGVLADEYIERLRSMGRAETTLAKNEWHLKTLCRKLLDRPVRDITSAEVLDVIRDIEASGRIETAHNVRSAIGAVFRYAISTLRAENDPTFALRGALMPVVVTPQAAITEERAFGGLLRSIDEYDGWITLRAACRSWPCAIRAPSSFARPSGRISISRSVCGAFRLT